MGFVKISNGQVLAAIPYKESAIYTNAKVKSELESFIKNHLDINTPQVEVPEELTSFTATKDYEGISYSGGSILLQTSGTARLLKSTRENPIGLDSSLIGKHVTSDIYFSDDYTIKEVMDVMMDKLFYVDGKKEKYQAKYSVLSNDNISISIYQDGKYVSNLTFTYTKVPSQVGSFMYVGINKTTPKGTLLIEAGKNKTTFTEIFNFLLQHLSNTTTNSTNQIIDLNKETSKTVNGVLQHLNYKSLHHTH